MPEYEHVEEHFQASDTVRDIVIGMSDGLTVPFALAAGLSGAVDSPVLVLAGRRGGNCSRFHCHGAWRISRSKIGCRTLL